jgi:hypothetical protein
MIMRQTMELPFFAEAAIFRFSPNFKKTPPMWHEDKVAKRELARDYKIAAHAPEPQL